MSDDSEYKSHPIISTKGGAELFLKRHAEAEKLFPCYLGHFDCSPNLYGPCLDETLSRFPELAD
jgi:hypothetical protein